MRRLIITVLEHFNRKYAGPWMAGFFFVMGLLFAIFGFWKTFFILLFTILGYVFGVKVIANPEILRRVIDKILPPGRFR